MMYVALKEEQIFQYRSEVDESKITQLMRTTNLLIFRTYRKTNRRKSGTLLLSKAPDTTGKTECLHAVLMAFEFNLA